MSTTNNMSNVKHHDNGIITFTRVIDWLSYSVTGWGQVQLEEEEVINPAKEEFDFNITYSKRLKLRPDGTVICHPIKERTFTLDEVDDLMNKAFVGGWIQANAATDKKPYKGYRDWQEENHPQ